MSGLFRRLSSRRSAGPDGAEPAAQAEPGTTDAPTNAPAEPGGQASLLTDPAAPRDDLQTRVLPEGEPAQPSASADEPAQPDPAPTAVPPERPLGELAPVIPPAAPEATPLPASDLPAGLDPDELLAAPPSSARRGRLRRRVAFLRAAREVLLRDLGGFAYEIHRTASDVEAEAHRRLREIKLARLTRLDAELHELELRLDDVRRHVVVREPGVGGECPQCGELYGSDANYCGHCGVPLTDAARKAIARDVAAAEPAPVAPEPAALQPAPRGQSTEEFTPVPESEFQWPHRDAETGDESPSGQAAATPGDEPKPPAGDEPPTAVEPPAPAGDETTIAEPTAPPADDPGAAKDASDEGRNGRDSAYRAVEPRS